MVEKLINKIIKEAKEKSKRIIEEGKKKFEKKLEIEKEKVNKEFEEKLRIEKEKIDKEIEREIINYRIEIEKEILKYKNQLVEKVFEKLEEKFNKFLDENFGEILKNFVEKIREDDIQIIVPEGKNLNLNYTVLTDKNMKNSFKIKSKNWEIDFSWENVKKIFEDDIKEKVNELMKF